MNHLDIDERELEREITAAVFEALQKRGIPEEVLLSGLGEEVDEGDSPLASISKLTESDQFQEARKKLTPWLWVFSAFGFYMALVNTHRIKKIFKSWKGARQYAKTKD